MDNCVWCEKQFIFLNNYVMFYNYENDKHDKICEICYKKLNDDNAKDEYNRKMLSENKEG